MELNTSHLNIKPEMLPLYFVPKTCKKRKKKKKKTLYQNIATPDFRHCAGGLQALENIDFNWQLNLHNKW